MGWLVLWVVIGLLQLGVLAGCGWMLWRKGRALWDECRSVTAQLGEVTRQLEGLGWAADGAELSAPTVASRGGSTSRP